MKRLLLATLLCAVGHCALGADTDGDGLLDLIDVPGFNHHATGGVFLSQLGIQDLDGANLLSNATGLFLGANQIASIERGDFQGLSNLNHLNLDDNHITSLENGDFEGLSNLDMLDLGRNQITSVANGGFEGLSNLRWVYLSDNHITGLENGVFQGLENLQEIYLNGNQITSLENGDFEGLSNLQWLELASNQIRSIRFNAFQTLSNLQLLALNGNQITSIEHGTFKALSNLQTLNLDGNGIATLENEALQGLGSLSGLNLRNNDISQLNLTGATFNSLAVCGFRPNGFCVDTEKITGLTLDYALLSQRSFEVVLGQTNLISDVSLVGLEFSDRNPGDLSALLSISTLDNVRVDQTLFDRYAAEFAAFDAMPNNTVTVVPEPAALFLFTATSVLAWLIHRLRRCEQS